MRNKVINKIESCGFKVDNRGQIFKFSNSTKSKEKAGQVNERSVYFYAQNVAPFISGTNSFKQILGQDYKPTDYVPYVSAPDNAVKHSFSFQDYIRTTKSKNQFSLFLKQYTNKNPYDIRGVKNGYLEDATLFPYINYNDKFLTAKIVKYNSKTGKRIKGDFTNNWFHSYKPIKKDLGLYDNVVKVSNNCYFGEHLLKGNNKPVVIVEAEKTAILLSFLYNDIVFIATGGLNKLKTLDCSFLLKRNVYVFPDNGAGEWLKIAKKRNWWCSLILENKGTKGSDVADYFDTEIGNEIAKELDAINNKELKDNIEDINFSLKEKQSYKYCIPNLFKLGLNYYTDDSKGYSFNGKHFSIYEDKFEVLNANIDFNKYQRVGKKLIPIDANVFIIRLEKCFRIMKHLNPNVNHKKVFKKVLNHLLEHSNFLFNRKYILSELLPMWDNDTNDVSEYYKQRNWRFKSKDQIEDKDFTRYLNNDKKAFSTNKLLLKLQKVLNKKEYIKGSDIGLRRQDSNLFVWNLIKDFNQNVLGCNTINNYKKKLEVNEYMNFVNEMTNELSDNKILYKYLRSTYYTTNIECVKSSTTFKKPSIQVVYDNTLIHKSIIREYISFKPNKEDLLRINTSVSYLISNPLDLKFERINKRIEVTTKKSFEYMLEYIANDYNVVDVKEISLKDAFDYEQDLSNSILNVSEEEALQRGSDFLYSWIIFNTPEQNFTDNQKALIKLNPLLFLNNTTILIAS